MKEDLSELEDEVEEAGSKKNMAEPYLSAQEGLTTDTAISGNEGDNQVNRDAQESAAKAKSPLEAAMNKDAPEEVKKVDQSMGI